MIKGGFKAIKKSDRNWCKIQKAKRTRAGRKAKGWRKIVP
jgi:hypothetical protein